jgi:hypothetical protein
MTLTLHPSSNPRFPRPTISERKEDETAFINARTYWSLNVIVDDGASYELRVRHGGDEDTFRFLSHDAERRDPLELITLEDWKERLMMLRTHEDMSHDDAEAALDGKVEVMTRGEVEILGHLVAYWNAFTLLFRPAINL